MNLLKYEYFQHRFVFAVVFAISSLVFFAIYWPTIARPRFGIVQIRRTHMENSFETNQIQRSYKSTCSHSADRRGPHQKVIAYSVYGNLSNETVAKHYLNPLKDSIKLIPQFFPGWFVRIYHNIESFHELNFPVESFVDLCNVTEISRQLELDGLFARTWRWLPLLDEMVDTFMSRDSDSRIILREVDAVSDWLSCNRLFHIMRDHPAHCTSILAGLWGVKLSQNRTQIVDIFNKLFRSTKKQGYEYNYDQFLLDKYIWPIAKTNLIAHDSFCCDIYESSQPFPTRRRNRFFVGARAFGNNQTEELSDMDECPEQCRPPNIAPKSEWNFC